MGTDMKTKAKTPGRRIIEPPHTWQAGECPYKPGDYWKDEADNSWHGCTPNGLLCWLKDHHVEENDDGTIDVVSGPWGSNSILVNGGRANAWHGAIQKGIWIEF
jgi:hypothetical protein